MPAFAQDKQLMSLMRTMNDSNTHRGSHPDDSVISMGLENASSQSNSNSSTMSGIQVRRPGLPLTCGGVEGEGVR